MCYTALLGNEISEKAELGLRHLSRQLPDPACFTRYWVWKCSQSCKPPQDLGWGSFFEELHPSGALREEEAMRRPPGESLGHREGSRAGSEVSPLFIGMGASLSPAFLRRCPCLKAHLLLQFKTTQVITPGADR